MSIRTFRRRWIATRRTRAPRARLPLATALLTAFALLVAGMPGVSAASTADVAVSVVRSGINQPGHATAVRLRLPANVAAVDGRVLLKKGAAEVIGVAPLGRGTAFRPVTVPGGAAFGAFGLVAVDGRTVMDIVLVPARPGRLEVRVVIDAAADKNGQRIQLLGSDRLASMSIAGSSEVLAAPRPSVRPTPTQPSLPTRELFRDGRVDKRDLDIAWAGWEDARLQGAACGAAGRSADANSDGCIDIVDVQAVQAAKSHRSGASTIDPAAAAATPQAVADPTTDRTLTVNSVSDTPDVAPGNGVCADSLGLCTLRAAMMEAEWLVGDELIAFSLPGVAPVLIQLSGALPIVTSRNGTMTIDGYTQPGSAVNTATVGSNAIPGVELRGNGSGAREIAIRIFSARNTVRGLLMNNMWRAISPETTGARGNHIIGNLIGFTRTGALSSSGQFAVALNTGANGNVIGTPDLADRNVIGNYSHAIENYGPGVDGNIIQNNVLCLLPSGLAAATCSNGIDHNFGPKLSLIGGTGPNERNIIGPTTLQCIEFSHGWDPAGIDASTKYQINGHRVIGNWLGFRGDGRYNAAFRCGLNNSTADNAQGINVYDGSNDNLLESNTIASVYDGIQLMSSNANRNTARGNIIGVSPLGEPAPLSRWGIVVRLGTKSDVVDGNVISNAALGGVGLLDRNAAGNPAAVAYNVRISRNIVRDTNGPAIDLYPGAGPNANDPGDGDDGANTLLNTPEVTSATVATTSGTGVPGGTIEVFRASRAAGAFGLPTAFLGQTTVSANGTWTLPVSLQTGDRVTALQISGDNNTSELSVNVAVGDAPPPPPPPVPGEALASDDFERTRGNGWGDATQGGTWAHYGPAGDYSVAGGTGRMSVPAGNVRESRLAVNVADVVITGRVSFDRVPTAGNAFAYVVARGNSAATSGYRAQIKVPTSGQVLLMLRKAVNGSESGITTEVTVPGLSAAGGNELAFRLEVVGSDLRFRVWDAGDPEPPTWNRIASDSSLPGAGATGLRAYTGGSVSNGPVVVSLDGLEIRRP